MSEELGILIQGKIDLEKTVSQINNDLKSLTKQIQSISLNIDTSQITKDIEKQIGNIQKVTNKSIDMDLSSITKESGQFSDSIKELEKQYQGTTQSIVKNTAIAKNEFGDLQEQIKSYLVTLKTIDNETKKIRIEPQLDDNDKEVLRQTEVQTINKANQEREKALKYEQQVRQQLDRNNAQEQERIKKLQQQLEIEQRMAAVRVQDFRRRYDPVITPDQNKQLDDYVASMNRLTATTPNLQHQIRSINTGFKEISASVAEAGSRTDSFISQLEVAMSRIPIWMVGMTAFYLPLRKMQDALQQIIELDSQMTVLERVSNGAIDINRAMEESINIAERLGNTISSVNDGLIEFARQGYRGEDLSNIAEVATIMGNVSDLEISESASALTASLKGFNIEAKDAIGIVDALNEVDKIVVPYIGDSISKPRICWKPF